MNFALKNETVEVRPITLVDALSEKKNEIKKSSLLKIFGFLFQKQDLNYEAWKRLESKPRMSRMFEDGRYY